MLLMAIYLLIASLDPAANFNSEPLTLTIWIYGGYSLIFAGICAFIIKNLVNTQAVDLDINQEDMNRYQLQSRDNSVRRTIRDTGRRSVTGL